MMLGNECVQFVKIHHLYLQYMHLKCILCFNKKRFSSCLEIFPDDSVTCQAVEAQKRGLTRA